MKALSRILVLIALSFTGSLIAVEPLPDWCLELVRAGKEPVSIASAAADTEQYRFIYSPSFSVPLIIRVSRNGDRVTLRAVQFTGVEIGHVYDARSRTLSAKEWQAITTSIESARFWAMPPADDAGGFDGNNWFLEGTRNGSYHAVTRWSPTYNLTERGLQQFVVTCRYLLKLSTLDINIQ